MSSLSDSIDYRYTCVNAKEKDMVRHQQHGNSGENFSFFSHSLLAKPAVCLIAFSVWFISGCTGVQTMSSHARAGDTVALTFGIQRNAFDIKRENTFVTITDSTGAVFEYPPGDDRLRAVLNLYPDPASILTVSRGIGLSSLPGANVNSSLRVLGLGAELVAGGYDFSQPVAILDLPETINEGPATILLSSLGASPASLAGDTVMSTVNILPGTGEQHEFEILDSTYNATLTHIGRVRSLERYENTRMRVIGTNIDDVAAIEIGLQHAPDINNGGVGRFHIVSPMSDTVGLSATDDGNAAKILVLPVDHSKFYPSQMIRLFVTGGIQDIQITNFSAYDATGNIVPDVKLKVSPIIREITPAGPISAGTEVIVSGESLCGLCDGDDEPVFVIVDSDNNEISVSPSVHTRTEARFNLPSGIQPGYATLVAQDSVHKTGRVFESQ